MELLMLYSILLFSLSFPTTKSSAQDPTYVWSICSNTTFPRNSQYQTNLNTVLRSLSTNATANPTGFFSTSAGTTASDTVYGFYLCRGDQNATACRACVAIATSTDLPKSYCPKGKQAVIWYDQCMVRYSNESLTGGNYSTTKISLMNTQNIPGNRTRFTDLVRNTMNQLAVQVPRSRNKYGTKQVNFTKTQPVYALQQCIPDLTENDCGQCLKYGIGNLMMTKEGAQVLTGSCIVRFEIYPFYNGAVNYTQSSPPAISNSTRGKRWTIELVNNCSYTVWPACSTTSIDFSLPQASSHVIDIPSGSSTRLWARTHCATSSAGNFSCKTGDCGSGQINCFGKFPIDTMPTNMVEFCLRDGAQMDFYDVTLVVGYNVPVMVAPQADGCQATGCIFDVDGACPHVLKRSGACNGPCVVFKTTEYRCNFSASEPNSYSRVFKKACPRANGYDDASTFSCKGAPYYVITYCPSSQIMASAFLQKSHQSSSSPSQLLSPTTSPTISPPGKKQQGQIYLFVAIPIAILIMLLFSIWVFMHRRKAKKRYYELNEIKSAESLQFDLNTIKTATHNFLAENKLGEGGFGEVYKGKLESRQEIAVKRLSKTSGQGVLEFKTEVVLVAKLQHKNLVKLLGFCLESEEKILVYEYLPNSSLDKFLFDPMMHVTLDWQTRLKIIIGIARGLLYLHEDSRLKVIHRDLKTSNILLDKDMNPKISDFGLAKLFGVDQTQGDTNRIVGTYGYMAPEYAITGLYSVKSDVYSFGVILLEIVSGQKSRFFSLLQTEEALLHRAWRLWNARKPLDLVDRTLNNFSVDEVMKCIHIGLLCIQEDAAQRPRMTSIVAAFSSHSISLPMPKPPHFFGNANVIEEGHALDENDTTCIYTGTKTITNLYPRD